MAHTTHDFVKKGIIMKKRFFALLLSLTLSLSLIPAVSADYYIESPHIEIGSNGVFNYEPENIPPLDKDYTGNGWSWDSKTYTLTLDNVNDPDLSLVIAESTKSVTIVVKGTNTLDSITEYRSTSTRNIISTLTGDGTLNVRSAGVDIVDGPKVNVEGGISMRILKSGSVAMNTVFRNNLEIEGGCLIIDAREELAKYGYKDENMKAHNSAIDVSVDNINDDFLKNCTLTDENGKPVTLKKTPVIFSSGNIVGYDMTAVKEDGTPAEYVKVMTPGYSPFADVKAGEYYTEPVMWAVDNKITNGTSASTFSPDQNCTRAQIITFLWRAAGSPAPGGASTVTDVKAGEYYSDAVAWSAEKGIIEGTVFRPDDPCTRLAAVEFMWKFAGSPASLLKAPFTDVDSDAVSWALFNGVTKGTSDVTFSPDNVCTRGQIVTFLYRGFAN